MKTMKLAVLMLACVSLPAWANGYMNGNTLHTELEAYGRVAANQATPSDPTDAFEAIGYIAGVADAFNGAVFCMPQGTSRGQVHAIVKKYVDDNPAEWQEPAASLVAASLKAAFPCNSHK